MQIQDTHLVRQGSSHFPSLWILLGLTLAQSGDCESPGILWGCWQPVLLACSLLQLFLKSSKAKQLWLRHTVIHRAPRFSVYRQMVTKTPCVAGRLDTFFFHSTKCYGDLKRHERSQKCLSWHIAYLSSSLISRLELQDLPMDLAALQTSPPLIGAALQRQVQSRT